MIFYFSFFIQMLYHVGVMQWIILNIGRILQGLMGTSICESLDCSANIFIGMVRDGFDTSIVERFGSVLVITASASRQNLRCSLNRI